jgi:myo-inositol-1(or 4)-monophosphatase
MKPTKMKVALEAAVQAALRAGELMRKNFRSVKKVHEIQQHDIKLELDVRCQKLIERTLLSSFPSIPLLGEEGISGDPEAEARWVVDPIDGTVNFAYGIPHACVSVALQGRKAAPSRPARSKTDSAEEAYEALVGVVYDPFCNELWTAIRGQPARLNRRVIRVSSRGQLSEAVISIGFAKKSETINQMVPALHYLAHRVRKIRIMGSAALSLVYVASGRFDAYVEAGIRLWDIAAGGLIVESAGGEFWHRGLPGDYTYELVASNGLLRKQLRATQKAMR